MKNKLYKKIDGYNILITDGWCDIPLNVKDDNSPKSRWERIVDSDLWVDSGCVMKNETKMNRDKIEQIVNQNEYETT